MSIILVSSNFAWIENFYFDCHFLPSLTAGTPYEGGLFRVKLVLGKDFPAAPPKGRTFFVSEVQFSCTIIIVCSLSSAVFLFTNLLRNPTFLFTCIDSLLIIWMLSKVSRIWVLSFQVYIRGYSLCTSQLKPSPPQTRDRSVDLTKALIKSYQNLQPLGENVEIKFPSPLEKLAREFF